MQEASYEYGINYYDLMYIETINKILVWKNFKPAYLINVIHLKDGGTTLVCNCLGGRYNQTCHHERASRMFLKFDKVVKPRIPLNQIIEEYVTNWINFQLKGWR